jgi:hypothetical protein
MSEANDRPPIGVTTTLNEFEVRKFTGGALADNQNHVTTVMPDAHWSGKRIWMLATGGDCHFAFTKKSDAEINRAVVATEAGVSTNVGGILQNGIARRYRLPYWDANSPLYFARESSAAAVPVIMWLSDEPGQKRAP